MPTRTQRVPLGDLPLVDFLPHPNGASGKAHGFPSPLSLPTKRGPPTPSRGPASPSTPKRRLRSAAIERISESQLGTDELGTGKSPARRLFVNESPATPETPRAVASTSLAPSPPLSSTSASRSDMPPPPSSRDPLHDCGFVIYTDPAGAAKPQSSDLEAPPTPVSHHDEENTPPCQATPTSKPSRTLRTHNSPAIRAA